jgi:hypothetical protein
MVLIYFSKLREINIVDKDNKLLSASGGGGAV